MNTPVSFPLARLLKDKNIHILSAKSMYASNGELTDAVYDFDNWCFAPTISDVIMWLYEKHEVWVSVKKDWDAGVCFGFESIIDNNEGFVDCGTFITPTEAYEAAIEYALNNLI